MAGSIPVELVGAARGGGPAEIERLIEAAWPDAYRLAFAVLFNAAAAEDAAQEACITVYRTIRSLRAAEAFGVWFYRIVIRKAAAQRRNLSSHATPPNAIEGADVVEPIDLWRALATLPEKLRDVVVLRYFEDLSSREIAQVLGIPDGTVRFRLMTAMRRLRPLLDERLPEPIIPGGEVISRAL